MDLLVDPRTVVPHWLGIIHNGRSGIGLLLIVISTLALPVTLIS